MHQEQPERFIIPIRLVFKAADEKSEIKGQAH